MQCLRENDAVIQRANNLPSQVCLRLCLYGADFSQEQVKVIFINSN
jgi:hypothetical protein